MLPDRQQNLCPLHFLRNFLSKQLLPSIITFQFHSPLFYINQNNYVPNQPDSDLLLQREHR